MPARIWLREILRFRVRVVDVPRNDKGNRKMLFTADHDEPRRTAPDLVKCIVADITPVDEWEKGEAVRRMRCSRSLKIDQGRSIHIGQRNSGVANPDAPVTLPRDLTCVWPDATLHGVVFVIHENRFT